MDCFKVKNKSGISCCLGLLSVAVYLASTKFTSAVELEATSYEDYGKYIIFKIESENNIQGYYIW